MPPASLSDYITAKYGLMGLCKSLAVELAKYNCTINMISPGMTKTDLLSNLPPKLIEMTALQNPLKRIASVKDVANVADRRGSGNNCRAAAAADGGTACSGEDTRLCGVAVENLHVEAVEQARNSHGERLCVPGDRAVTQRSSFRWSSEIFLV